MKNKKARIETLIIIPVIFIFLMGLTFIGFMFYELWSMGGERCDYYDTLKIKSINGMRDENTGILSGGTVNQKDILFDNGLLLTFQSWELKNIELKLGEDYRIQKCENNGRDISYKLKRIDNGNTNA